MGDPVTGLTDGTPSGLLPRVMHEAEAAVLLVDLQTSNVVHANRPAVALAGEHALPVGVDEWGRRAGLLDRLGDELATSEGPLSRVARGEPVSGVLVRRRTGDPVWVTAFPLGPGDPRSTASGSTASGSTALVVLMPLSPTSAPPSGATGADPLDRAVLATGFSFSISDPGQPDDPLVWVNPAFTATTGYTAEQALGRNCRFLQGPGTDTATVGRIRAALERGEAVTETLLNYRADGTAFWNEVSISPVLDGSGRLVHFVGVQADVTTRVGAEAERQSALQAERRARADLALLSQVAEATAELDGTVAMQHVAEVLSSELVAWCGVVVADGHLRVVATAGEVTDAGPDGLPLQRITGDGTHDPVAAQLAGTDVGLVDLAGSGAPWADGSVTRWLAQQLCTDSSRPCLSLAIPGRRGVLGLLVVGPHEDEPDDRTLQMLREVARRVGLAMENARLYAREHTLAETLQRSMLPEQAGVADLDVWSYYAPNLDHAQVGGDWYDVLQIDADTVGLVVGDVVGHDVEAAASMGQLRSVVRAYSYDGDEPGTVLMRVDQLVSGMRIPRSASMVYATLTRAENAEAGWDLAWSRAGHLPPLLVSRGEVQVLSEAGGTLVGVGDRPRATASRRLSPGDVLVLYTDGLIERRQRPMMDGLQLLREVCSGLTATDAAGIGEQLLDALGDGPEDDIAVVVLTVPVDRELVRSPEGTPRQRRWQLPGDPTSIGRARRLTLQASTGWGLSRGSEAELVVSELVANAVLHGWGPVGLRLRHSGRGLVIEVDDANPAPPSPVLDAGQDLGAVGGYGMHVVQRLAEWGWHPSGAGKTVWARLPEDDAAP